MRRLRLLLVLISLVALAAAPAPVSAERGSWNNWHVHDGGSGTDANGLRHAGVAFFPEIWPTYASDESLWAYCADATDKGLVGGDGGAKLVAGHCQNELYIIHLQGIANDAPAPPLSSGWTPLTPGAEFTIYYKLTAR